MKTSVYDLMEGIVFGKSLSDKLTNFPLSDLSFDQQLRKKVILPKLPSREHQISISKKQIKFPKTFSKTKDIAKAMHFFANHELLAIEMMAMALIIFPIQNDFDLKFHKKIYSNLLDEQKHLSLYLRYMEERGITLGDFPLNNHFWKYMEKMKNLDQFFAVMALTFEAANLDFAKHYSLKFREIGDVKSSKIMDVIYFDEIKHVQCGQQYLSYSLKKGFKQDITSYYSSLLPSPLTPARAKGNIFDEEGRKKALMDEGFISYIKNYRDDFLITDRRQWKKENSI